MAYIVAERTGRSFVRGEAEKSKVLKRAVTKKNSRRR